MLAPRRSAAATPKAAEAPLSVSSRSSPLSWLGRKAIAEPILTAGIATAVPGWKDEKVGGGVAGGGVLIRGVEVSSKEVADHTGFSRQHVLLGRTDRETAGERPGTTAQRYACVSETVCSFKEKNDLCVDFGTSWSACYFTIKIPLFPIIFLHVFLSFYTRKMFCRQIFLYLKGSCVQFGHA